MKKPLTKIKNLYDFPSLKNLGETFGMPYKTVRNLDSGGAGRHTLSVLTKIAERSGRLTAERRKEIRRSLKPSETGFYLDALLDFLVKTS